MENQAIADRSRALPENLDAEAGNGEPIVVTQQSVLRDLGRIQRNAEADGAYPSALRSLEVKAKIGGVSSSGRNANTDEPRSPSPGELHGLPITRY